MAENKKSFLLYSDYKELFLELSDQDAGQLIKHIFSYVNDENPISENPIVKISFIPIKNQLKRDLKVWEVSKEDKSNSGVLGNLKRWNLDLYDKVLNNELTISQAQIIAKHRKTSQPDKVPSHRVANIAVNVTDTVNVNVNDNVNVRETVNGSKEVHPRLSESVKQIDNREKDMRQVFFNDFENSYELENICRDLKKTKQEVLLFMPKFLLKANPTYINFKDFTSHYKRCFVIELLNPIKINTAKELK